MLHESCAYDGLNCGIAALCGFADLGADTVADLPGASDRLGDIATCAYDAGLVGYSNATDHATPVRTVDFGYDANGNLSACLDRLGVAGAVQSSALYTYDDLNRKTGTTVYYPGFIKTFSNAYPDNWHRTFTGPDQIPAAYGYDAAQRLAEVRIGGQLKIDYRDFTWRQPGTMNLPDTTVNYQYDQLQRPTTISAPRMSREYSYSPAGNILLKKSEHGSYSYRYDAVDRLAAAYNPKLPDEGYTYDALGNRKSDAAVAGGLAYNKNNELTSLGAVTLSHDLNGNMLTNPSRGQAYVYDEANRMVEVDGAAGVIARYGYDPFGRRIWKELSDGTRIWFLYADEGLIGEYDNSGNEIASYGYVPGSTWTVNPLWQKTGGEYFWYLNDHLGTPQKMIDSNGLVVWS